MNDHEFRAALDWYMASDPWPAGEANHGVITAWLDRESISRGFTDWVEAFHRFGKGQLGP